MKRTGSVPAILLLCSLRPADAQVPVALDSLRVFAERAATMRPDGTQAIAVVTRADIESRRPANVAELLREVAGLHVDRVGTSGPANVYVRGAEPNHTVVLIDGVRVNDPTDVRGGGFDLSALSVHEIERIEVLRGASSAQFGADAMGGVVNIVTRRAGKARGEAGASFGGWGHREAHARISGAGATLGASRRDEGRERDGGESRSETVDAAWSSAFDRGELRLQARAGRLEASGFPESSGGVRLAQSRELERREVEDRLASSAWEGASGPWRWTLRAASSDREESRATPAVLPGPGGFVPAAATRTDFRRRGASAQVARESLPWGLELSGGLEAWREDGTRDSTLFIPDPLPGTFSLSRDTRSGFVQARTVLGPATELLVAARHDDVDPGGSRSTHSAGLRQELGGGHALRAHWSQGFKPPSFFSLADPLVGNPDLRPETSRNAEVGWDLSGESSRVQLTLFRARAEDLVDFDPESFRMVNRPGARTRGGEIQARSVLAAAWRAEATYTYVDAELLGVEARLRNRPRHRATAALTHDRGPWSLRLAALHVGRTFDFSVPTGTVELPAFTTLDFVARYRGARFDAGIAADNLTDRRHESFVGFTVPGRRVRAFATLRF